MNLRSNTSKPPVPTIVIEPNKKKYDPAPFHQAVKEKNNLDNIGAEKPQSTPTINLQIPAGFTDQPVIDSTSMEINNKQDD